MALRKSGEKILFFDEFAVSNRPTTFYGWAEKNRRPEVASDESKKREKLHGLLAVDAQAWSRISAAITEGKDRRFSLVFWGIMPRLRAPTDRASDHHTGQQHYPQI
jgi:hypothetical protein